MPKIISVLFKLLEFPKIVGIDVAIALGYVMACTHKSQLFSPILIYTLVGNALAAGSSFIFNQVIERRRDALMTRTQNRPLPAQQIPTQFVVLLGVFLLAAGLLLLASQVNPSTAMITFYISVLYVVIYTPLKAITRWNTFFGALSGFLLPFAGWLAVQPQVSWATVFLGLAVFFWQHPHSHAISVLFADDYEKGGYRMIPLLDKDLKRTRTAMLLHSLMLLPVSLLPVFWDRGNWFYSVTAAIASFIVVFRVIGFYRRPQKESAREVLTSTLLYLPILLVGAYLDLRLF